MENKRSLQIRQLRELLRTEQNTQSSQWDNAGTGIKVLRSQGVLIHPIRIFKKSFGFADYPIIAFNFSHDVNPSIFKEGAPVTIFEKDTNLTCSAVVRFISSGTGELLLYAPDFPDWIDHDQVGIKLSLDTKSFDLMHGVLKKIDKEEDRGLTHLFDLLHGIKALPDTPSEKCNRFFNDSLNESQRSATEKLISETPVGILHGPPGTGKTTTLVEVVQQLLQRGKKVLVSAPSNTAIDHFAQRLIALGTPIFRFGNTSKVNPNIWKHTADGILSQEPYAKQLKKLRIKADEFRKLAQQYKRNFGKSEREQRKLMYQEVKLLRKEIRETSNYYLEKSLEQAAVILGTPVGLRDSLAKTIEYDVAILDEAGQCLEPMAWIALQMAPKMILAGDPHQLPPTVIDHQAAKEGLSTSILERGFLNELPRQFLSIQYRMPPAISGFSSQMFYKSELQSNKENDSTEKHLYFFDTAGADYTEVRSDGFSSIHNPGELNFIKTQHEEWIQDETDVVLISPYAGQVQKAKEELPQLKASTIDGFQGQEAEIIILSLVRSNIEGTIGFLKDYRRMNVALTRAKYKLIVIGDSATLGIDPFYQDFLSYIESEGSYRSVFEFEY